MSLVKRNRNLFSHPALFNDFFSNEFFNWGNTNFSATLTTVPSVNIKENAANFEVEVAAPGMEKNDFKITLEGNTLTISSSKDQQQEEQEGSYTRREFSYQSFLRTFQLPKDVVDEARITAKYDNGVLRLTIPKTETAQKKQPRMIEIS